MLKDSELAAIKKASQEGLLWKFGSTEILDLIARLKSAEAALRKCRDTAIEMDDTAWQMTERHFDQVKG